MCVCVNWSRDIVQFNQQRHNYVINIIKQISSKNSRQFLFKHQVTDVNIVIHFQNLKTTLGRQWVKAPFHLSAYITYNHNTKILQPFSLKANIFNGAKKNNKCCIFFSIIITKKMHIKCNDHQRTSKMNKNQVSNMIKEMTYRSNSTHWEWSL